MQTITLKIKNNYLNKFMEIIDNCPKNKLKIIKFLIPKLQLGNEKNGKKISLKADYKDDEYLIKKVLERLK